MKTPIKLGIERWTAYADGLRSIEEWTAWAEKPMLLPEKNITFPVQSVEANLRRRCSPLSRATIAAAQACVTPEELSNMELVFASRHGESDRSFSILKSIAQGEPISPNDFSLSVHNTSIGLFSMAFKNRHPATAISAGPETFVAALVESHCMLITSSQKVLLILVDQKLLPAFAKSSNNFDQVNYDSAYVLGLLLSPPDRSTADLELCFSKCTENRDSSEMSGDFLRWIFARDLVGSHEPVGVGTNYHLKANPQELRSKFVCL